MSEAPNYYAILTANVRYSKLINANEKLLFAEITALSNSTGICWASNNYFANLFDMTPQAISKWIRNLEKNHFIKCNYVYKKGSKEIEKREIVCINHSLEGINNGFKGINHSLEGYQHTIKDNNTSINNISNNREHSLISSFFNENKEIQKDDKTINILSDFVTYRKKIKKQIKTTASLKLYYNKLKELHQDGFNIHKCIEEMKIREWQMIDKEYLKNRNDLKVINTKANYNTLKESDLI